MNLETERGSDIADEGEKLVQVFPSKDSALNRMSVSAANMKQEKRLISE